FAIGGGGGGGGGEGGSIPVPPASISGLPKPGTRGPGPLGRKPSAFGGSSTKTTFVGRACGVVNIGTFASARLCRRASGCAENTGTACGFSTRGSNKDASIGGIVIACVCKSGISASAPILRTCAITDTTTVMGFRVFVRRCVSNKES